MYDDSLWHRIFKVLGFLQSMHINITSYYWDAYIFLISIMIFIINCGNPKIEYNNGLMEPTSINFYLKNSPSDHSAMWTIMWFKWSKYNNMVWNIFISLDSKKWKYCITSSRPVYIWSQFHAFFLNILVIPYPIGAIEKITLITKVMIFFYQISCHNILAPHLSIY